MKHLILSAVAAICVAGCCTAPKADAPKISLFAHDYRKIAKQQNVSLAEAAAKMRAVGVVGFDDNFTDKNFAEYVRAGLTPCNVYGWVHFLGPDKGEKEGDEFIATAVRWGVPRIMCIPDNFSKNGDKEAEFKLIVAGLKKLVEKGARAGVKVTVEDFGGEENPCSYAKYLKRMLDEIPDLGFAADSGNLVYANRGDCVVDVAKHANKRIRHVHLKDQSAEDPHKYVTLGEGQVPNEKLVKYVSSIGYDGWYTIENPVGDVAADVERQVGVLRGWLK